MIPEEAAEAAARALFLIGFPEGCGVSWEPLSPIAQGLTRDMLVGLEAAAPHMLADAWELGMVSMYATTGGEWPLIPEQNPYRPTA